MLKIFVLCKKIPVFPGLPLSLQGLFGVHMDLSAPKRVTKDHGRDIPDPQGEIPMVGISQMHEKGGLSQIHSQKAQPTSLYLWTLGLTGPKWLRWKGWACSQYNGPEVKRDSLGDHCPCFQLVASFCPAPSAPLSPCPISTPSPCSSSGRCPPRSCPRPSPCLPGPSPAL